MGVLPFLPSEASAARAPERGRARSRPVRRRRRVALVAVQQSLDVAEATVANALVLLRRVWQPEMERTVSPFAFALCLRLMAIRALTEMAGQIGPSQNAAHPLLHIVSICTSGRN